MANRLLLMKFLWIAISTIYKKGYLVLGSVNNNNLANDNLFKGKKEVC